MDIQKYLTLRNFVLLGLEQYNWVNQKVLTNNSEAFLDYVLPKTKSKAAFNLSTNIACLEHDQNIQGNRIHLFRLPQSIEIKINSIEKDQNAQDIILGLSEIASGIAVETKPGAVNIGAITEIQTEEVLQAFAKHYLEAFKGGYKTYPYLS
jgi:hypothetical protein